MSSPVLHTPEGATNIHTSDDERTDIASPSVVAAASFPPPDSSSSSSPAAAPSAGAEGMTTIVVPIAANSTASTGSGAMIEAVSASSSGWIQRNVIADGSSAAAPGSGGAEGGEGVVGGVPGGVNEQGFFKQNLAKLRENLCGPLHVGDALFSAWCLMWSEKRKEKKTKTSGGRVV